MKASYRELHLLCAQVPDTNLEKATHQIFMILDRNVLIDERSSKNQSKELFEAWQVFVTDMRMIEKNFVVVFWSSWDCDVHKSGIVCC